MPEAVAETQQVTTTTDATSLGWRAGLPDDLKQNEAFVPFKTVGDFAKSHLEVSTKAKELEAKLGDSIPKLPDNATAEDRNLYYNALGRPTQASEYEFDGEDKNAPEWTNFWKGEFHGLGLTKDQAKQLSGKWNAQMAAVVKAHNDALAAETTQAEQKLRTELGDKYDTNVELAKRMWQKHGEGDFDKAFANAPGTVRFANIRMLLKFAALTGEDVSPQGGNSQAKNVPSDKQGWLNMYNNPVGGK